MTTPQSNAEQFADKARELPAFMNFSLPGVRKQISIMLSMIGTVKGIFSTYTVHNINHVDEMLNMLDWLIPADTKSKMASLDWLLIVLATYLHDLGMIVTEEEYIGRYENLKFTEFINNIKSDPENKDYIARVDKMTSDEKEIFFFQEYIRLNHAARVREWINGRHSSQWEDKTRVIADEIAKLLGTLPPRFLENLADICASHHLDNLDKPEYFPLTERYGTHVDEVANVQYAAIMLRTVDLLHVTKDRTPSIMYKIIRLSDPKGVDEWKKQMGIFSVYMKNRELDLNNPETHVITVTANFTEERSYFALAEYLAYANLQLEQSKRWADASQKTNDGKNYLFPWRTIKGNIRVDGHEPVQMRFDLDRGRLLDLLVGHTIYNDPTVAVRELLQNSIDAVRYQYYLEKKNVRLGQPVPEIGSVAVKWDLENKELIIEDNGIGMNLDVIQFNLMKVGASYYNTPKFNSENADFTPISRFGIGVLTCFMISDDIEITTCQADGGYRIKMTSVQSDYLIKKLEIGNPVLQGISPHGTRVKLQIRSSIEFTQMEMADIVQHWIIIPPCPVIYQEKDQEAIEIGFKNPAQALRYFYSQNEEALLKDDTKFEIVETAIVEDGAEYRLAFAVSKGYTPERNYILSNSNKAPAVCIEGIRTSNQLPGFGGKGEPFISQGRGICGLLSVCGNKKFRTTVSRMDLEQDDEYTKAAEICAKMLFKHITDEVKEISIRKNQPLSQASTAGIWMHERLVEMVSLKVLRVYLDKLYRELPLIVIETVELNDRKPQTSRKLLSQNKLEGIESFWTIESRLVDYLGIISRDMGRELSLNDFLNTLAPDFRDPRVSIVIPDADKFSKEIFSSHIAVRSEYSRKYQQTLIEWKQKIQQPDNCIINSNKKIDRKIINSIFINFADKAMSSRELLGRAQVDLFQSKEIRSSQFVPIIGDMKDIFAIRTRIANLIDPLSVLGKILITLSKLSESYKNELDRDYIVATIDIGIRIILKYVSDGGQLRDERFSALGSFNLRAVWKIVADEINKILGDADVKVSIPDRLEDIVGTTNIFDASRYWMNWSRSNQND